MKSAIVIDDWKLSIFERHLNESGYQFTNAGKFMGSCITLTVETDNLEALQIVVRAANKEAARTKGVN